MPQSFPVKFSFKAIDKLSKTIDRVRGKFPRLEAEVKKAARGFFLLQKKTEGFRRSLNKIGNKMVGVGKSLTTRLTLPIGLAGGAIIKTAVDFEKSMNRVGALTQTITRGQVAPAFDQLTEKAKVLGESTQFSASQVADAMGFLAQAGFEANEILQAIEPTLNLAAAANLDLAATADIASNIMGGFQLKATEMTRAADVLALVTAKSNTNLEQLGEAMQEAAPVASKFGASLETTAALAGLLGNVGIQGSKAGTTLKAMFTRLAAPTPKATKLLQGLGLSVADSTGKIRDINEILKDLAPRLGKLPQKAQLAVINELFGLRGIAGASELLTQAMKKGKNPIQAFTETLQNAGGSAKDMANTLMRGAPGAVKEFNSALEGLFLSIAKSGLIEFFTDVVKKLTEFFRWLSKTNPELLKIGTLVAGVAALLGPLIIGFGLAFKAVALAVTGFSAIASVLGPVIVGIKVVGAIIAGVLTPAVLIVGALAAAIYRVVSAWDELKQAFRTGGVLGTLKTFFGFGGGGAPAAGGAAFGPPVGAGNTLAQTAVNQTQTNNATVKVDFNRLPAGTRVSSQATGIPPELNLGFTGAGL